MDTAVGNPFKIPDFGRATHPLPLHDTQPLEIPQLEHPGSERWALDLEAVEYQQLEDFGGTLAPLQLPDISPPVLPGQTTFEPPRDQENKGKQDDEIFEASFWVPIARAQPARSHQSHLTWSDLHDARIRSGKGVSKDGEYDRPKRLFSEAGPAAFDAVLRFQSGSTNNRMKAGNAVKTNVLLHSIIQLALGRGSVIFPWNERKQTFEEAFEHARISGASVDSVESIIESIKAMGEATKRIRAHISSSYRNALGGSVSVRVAFARATEKTLDGIEACLVHKRAVLESLLQVEAAVELPRRLISSLDECISIVAKCNTDRQILEAIYTRTERTISDQSPFVELQLAMLAAVTTPLFDKVLHAICFRATASSIPPNETARAIAVDLPDFIPDELQALINDAKYCAEFLQEHRPESAAVAFSRLNTSTLHLQWGFTWQSVQKLHSDAKEAEHNLLHNNLRDHLGVEGSSNGPTKQATDASAAGISHAAEGFPSMYSPDFDAALIRSINILNRPLREIDAGTDKIHYLAREAVTSSRKRNHISTATYPPIDCSLSLSLRPLLALQQRILTHATLHSIFHEYDLQSHFAVHHAFSLCGSGPFVFRLQHALFSLDTSSAERTRGSHRSGLNMGLRLGDPSSRRDWPPASSELRLVLMHVLNDAWRTETSSHKISHGLPGNMFFKVREIASEAIIEKILDQDSIYALDFLHLAYTPPPPLRCIFTARVLDLYDRVFAFLLRLMRIRFVATHLHLATIHQRQYEISPATLRFRHEVVYFVEHLSGYIMHAGIEIPWRRFQSYIEQTATSFADALPAPSNDSASTPTTSVSALAALHENTLEEIAGNLLLRRKQRRAFELLEEMFGVVLVFAKAVRDDAAESRLHELLGKFRGSVKDFVAACMDSGEGKDWQAGTNGLVEALGYASQ